jgi:hypothetical protein
MTDYGEKSELRGRQVPDRDRLDDELDVALAKYAAAEPRAGLEERVLANLRAERARAAEHSWWRWPAVAALAVVIVVAASVAWRSWKPVQNITTQHRPDTTGTQAHAGTQVANNSGRSLIQPHEIGSVRRLKPRTVSLRATVASVPKLDLFPSPQPLSEQETILARYVTKYPEQAALIAQARTEELLRDGAEEMSEAGRNQDSQQRNK